MLLCRTIAIFVTGSLFEGPFPLNPSRDTPSSVIRRGCLAEVQNISSINCYVKFNQLYMC